MRRRFVWSYEYIENIHASSIFFLSLGISTSGGPSEWRHFQLTSYFSFTLALPFVATDHKPCLDPFELSTWKLVEHGLNASHAAMYSDVVKKEKVRITFDENLHLQLVLGHVHSHDSSIWAHIDKSGTNGLQDYNQPIDHDTWSLNPTSHNLQFTTYKLETTKRNLELKTTCLMSTTQHVI